MHQCLIGIFLILAMMTLDVKADPRVFVTQSINSEIMNESLDIHVQLPLFYQENSEYSYPVIYVLDAPVGLTLTAGILDPLVGYDNAPQMIIVGISTSNRARDLTPSTDSKYEPISGGADKYLSFITEEVIPFVEQNYRTEKFRILSGHSYGGLFTMHAFHTKPDFFQAYFAYSPSLHWDDQKTVEKVVSFVEKNNEYKNFLYMNIGNEGNVENDSPEGKLMLQGVIAIENSLLGNNTHHINYKIEKLFDEPHQTTQIFGTVSSFRHLYPQWSAPYQVFLDGYESILKHFEGLSDRYGYQIKPRDWLMNDEGLYQLNEKNNPVEALKYFTYNLQRYPTSISTLQNVVNTYIKLDNSKEALVYIDRLLAVPAINTEEKTSLLKQKASLLKNTQGM